MKRIKWLFVALALLVLWFLLNQPAWASGDDIELEAELQAKQIAGDVVTGSTRAYSLNMGDVDINQCRYSVQFPLAQWTRENAWCMADGLDAIGAHEAAAKVRCSTKTLSNLYEDESACRAAVRAVAVEYEPPAADKRTDDEDEYEQRFMAQQAEIESLKQLIEQAPPRPAATRTIVKQVAAEPLLTAEQAKLLRFEK